MADVTISADVLDNASKALLDIAGALKQVSEQADRTDDKLDGVTGASEGVASGMGKVEAAVGLVTAGLAAAVAGMTALIAIARQATDTSAEYESANQKLAASLVGVGVSASAVDGELDRLGMTIAALSTESGQSIKDLRTSLASLVTVTGSAAKAERDLALATDISARAGVDLEAATEAVLDARKGSIGPIANLIQLTEQEEEAIEALGSKAARSAKLMELLTERFKGARAETQSSQLAIANLSNTTELLTARVGDVVDRSGVFAAVLAPLTKRLQEAEKWIKANSVEAQNLAIDFGQNLVKALGVFAIILLESVDAAAALYAGVQVLGGSLKMLPQIVEGAALLVQAGMLELADDVLGAIEDIVTGMQRAATALGRTELAKTLGEGLDTVKRLRGGFQKELGDTQKAFKGVSDDINQTIDDQARALEGYAKLSGRLSDTRKTVEEITKAAGDGLETQRKTLKVIRDTASTTSKNAQTARKEVRALASAQAARIAMVKKLEVDAINTQRELLRATTDAQRDSLQLRLDSINREKERLGLESAAARQAQRRLNAEIKADELSKQVAARDVQRISIQQKRLKLAQVTAQTQETALQVELDFSRQLAEIDAQGLKGAERELALLDAKIERQERLNSLREQELQQLTEQRERLDGLAAGFESFASSSSVATRGVATGFAGVFKVVGQTREELARAGNDQKKAAKATENALAASGQAAVTFAGALGASAAQQAAILAAFELASAIAAFAVGNVASGAQHLISAGIYGSIAATEAGAGPSGGGSSAGVGGGGGGGATAGGGGANLEAVQQRSADMLAEAIGRELGGGGNTTIIYDNRGSLQLTPTGLYEQVREGGRTRGVDLDDVGRQSRRR